LLIWSLSLPFSLLWAVTKILVSSPLSTKDGWFMINFRLKITPLTRFYLSLLLNKWFSNLFCFFILWLRRHNATLVCSSSLCDIVCLSCFVQVFVRFRLSDQPQSSADPINDFGVVYIADPEKWVFWRLKYSHMCRLLYFVVLRY